MRPFVNNAALTTLAMDSASLGPMAMVLHPVAEAGSYLGTVYNGKEAVGTFGLEVGEDSDRMQADIDLSRFAKTGSASETRFMRNKMKTGGYLLLFVSQGRGDFRVTLEATEARKEPDKAADPVFDSGALGKGDLFAVTLLRPGAWTAEAKGSEGCRIDVTYPQVGAKPYRPSETGHNITAGRGKMSPGSLKIAPGEGVVFAIADDSVSRIRVSLGEPDDGPGDLRPNPKQGRTKTGKTVRRSRWQNPRMRG